jgi:hypothetical protein
VWSTDMVGTLARSRRTSRGKIAVACD